MNYKEFVDDFEAITTDVNTGIATTFIHGWLSTINEPFNNYDVFLLLPSKITHAEPRKRPWRKQFITCYLFTQNIEQSTKKALTPAERDQVWADLIIKMDKFIDTLNLYPNKYQILSEVNHDPDEGHIGTDDTIWIKTTFTLNVENCL
jgi:hypothetical protein